MILIFLSRGVITADQCLPLIRPITSNLGSSEVFAGISMTYGSLQSSWASMKSIPCFSRLADFSVRRTRIHTWYKNYTIIDMHASISVNFLLEGRGKIQVRGMSGEEIHGYEGRDSRGEE